MARPSTAAVTPKLRSHGFGTTERELREQVRDLCKLYGWRMAFTQYSIRSPRGFPDLVLVRPPRVIFAELKSAKGKLTMDQEAWLTDLRACEFMHEGHPGAIEVYLWYPDDLERIAAILGRADGVASLARALDPLARK